MRDITKYTKCYVEQPFENFQVAYRKKNLLEIINKFNHKHILEVGCGSDPLFNSFRDFNKLVIVEPSVVFYEKASNLLAHNERLKGKVDIINGYFEQSIESLKKYSFDFIIISCLLHELENAQLFIEKIHQIIGPETMIHVDVPNAHSFHRILAREMGLIESVFEMSTANRHFQQHKIFDLSSLSEIIIENKFQIIDSGSYFIKPFTHKQMDEMVENNIINKEVLDGFYNMTKYMPDLGSEIFINFKL